MDIIDHNRLEQELRQKVQESAEAEERMRSVVNHVVDGIITIDEQGTVGSSTRRPRRCSATRRRRSSARTSRC